MHGLLGLSKSLWLMVVVAIEQEKLRKSTARRSSPLLPGRAIQQNQGAVIATGDTFLFLHADCALTPAAGEQIEAALQQPSCLGGAFRQKILSKGWVYRAIEKGNAQRVRWFKMPYGDQGLFFRRETFERLGGFPEVRLMEDLLIMRQFRKLAAPVLLHGPLYVGARRWKQQGPILQTFRNWALIAAERVGFSPDRLSTFYPLNSDKNKSKKTTTQLPTSSDKICGVISNDQKEEMLQPVDTING